MWKACSRCGRIHPAGYKCNVGRVYKGGEERKLRSQWSWNEKRTQIKEDAHYLCEVCRDHGILTYNDVEVHHIEKIKDRPDLFLEDSNLVVLCRSHHKDADDGKIDKDYLKALAKKREDN